MHLTRIAALTLLAALSLPAAAAVPTGATNTFAVIYDASEEKTSGDYDQVIAGIESVPDVIVYRVALNTGEQKLAAAPHTGRPIQLAYNDKENIAVIYPDVGEPYRSVFTSIIHGIEDKANTRVASYAIGANQDPQAVAAELRRQNIRTVIALGRNGLKTAVSLDRNVNIVVGGVLSAPEAQSRDMSIFSLAPDPYLLFGRLKALTPSIRRVIVVYDPRQNTWLIQLARDAASKLGLELTTLEATDLKTAMRLYQQSMASADPKRDALWLPQDSVTVDETSVLPYVLQESWSRGVTVFSSSVSHVKRGALFSLYPNNTALGRNLANSALNQASGSAGPSRAILPLRDVLVAVNIRTASHLGLNIGKQQSFDMVYPEP